jgi:hypothetical protein
LSFFSACDDGRKRPEAVFYKLAKADVMMWAMYCFGLGALDQNPVE